MPRGSRAPALAPGAPVGSTARAQVDFEKEAQHIAHFSEYLDRNAMRDVATCPYVYRPFSSKRLLTMERIRGAPLTDLDAIRAVTAADPETTLIGALNTWMGSVMTCETFHADVHAGNLLVCADGRVAFLDFGIVGRVSPVTWRAVEALATSIAAQDYPTMARALATMKATGDEVRRVYLRGVCVTGPARRVRVAGRRRAGGRGRVCARP